MVCCLLIKMQLSSFLRESVKPSLGCTEPVSVALASSLAYNAIYGSVGMIGVYYYHAGIYYERMFQKNSPKSKIATFVKVGYGGAVSWEASNQFFSGQYGILTGIKKHHVEGSLGLAANFGEDGDNMLGTPLTGSVG